MENCFRFLINVDQCLNMSYFDIFFYQLESQHKFHMCSVQTAGDSGQNSLRSAASDIRMYLNKYPYHVGDYQIIVAMRSVFQESSTCWEETMLSRLLRLEFELRNARILINSREQTEKALNLIMLYDSDFSADLPKLGSYKESGRLQKDCVHLLDLLRVSDREQSHEVLERGLGAYEANPQHDKAAAELLRDFLNTRSRSAEQFAQMAQHMDHPDSAGISLSAELTKFIRDRLCNMQLFEQQIDRNNRRQQTLALLRVVEFVNMSTELPAEQAGQSVLVPLAHRCAGNWNQIWQDSQLEQRYADMLRDYQIRLSSAAQELEGHNLCPASASALPEEDIPEDDAITCDDGIFSDKDPGEQKNNLKLILKDVMQKRFSLRDIETQWNKAYTSCKELLAQLEFALENYAEDLSRQYASTLEKRKKDASTWRRNVYIANENTQKDISRIAHQRDQRLQQLKTPRMNPTLNFQDQLNMENSLEQGNLLVQHYIRCLNAVTVGNFLLLMAVCVVMCFGHYTFLQTYVFQGMATVVYYLIYLAAILVLMLLCWLLPYNYFKRRLKLCIGRFQADAEQFITGYYTKAEQFGSYINLLNQLDYLTRYHRLLVQAHRTTHQLSQGYLWHKVQVRNHLSKLQFFHGLIELGNASGESNISCFLPGVDGTQVSDYIDSHIYWPQKRGG